MTRIIEETRTFSMYEVPEGIPQFLVWLGDILSDLPEESRNSARIEFDASIGFEYDIERNIEICWRRLETAEEKHRREHRHEAEARGRADGWLPRPWGGVSGGE